MATAFERPIAFQKVFCRAEAYRLNTLRLKHPFDHMQRSIVVVNDVDKTRICCHGRIPKRSSGLITLLSLFSYGISAPSAWWGTEHR